MIRAFAIIVLLALTGCASTRDWMSRHPQATAFIVGSAALSAGIAIHSRNDQDELGHDVTVPTAPCSAQRDGSCR